VGCFSAVISFRVCPVRNAHNRLAGRGAGFRPGRVGGAVAGWSYPAAHWSKADLGAVIPLAAGLSLALVGVEILYPALVIGIVAAGMTIIGLVFGRSVGLRFSRTAGVIGGLLLIGLAVKAVL